ncbi:MAG: hypothetical protein EOP19_00900 [Hyphomicrobiales bacterium]|nr:MAG: hypothetical protein EOP19_00900 [Hyphomicrobiales bacterium]
MTTSALAIFTGKATPVVLEVGGSQSWVLDQRKARACKYAVLYFNDHAPWSTKGFTEHGAAFLVGHISDVIQSEETPDRYLVVFDKYAEVSDAGAWGGWRNPIRYTSIEDLGIDEAHLEFKPMPKPTAQFPGNSAPPPVPAPKGLTIAAAKAGLAETFGVSPDAIEITIKG